MICFLPVVLREVWGGLCWVLFLSLLRGMLGMIGWEPIYVHIWRLWMAWHQFFIPICATMEFPMVFGCGFRWRGFFQFVTEFLLFVLFLGVFVEIMPTGDSSTVVIRRTQSTASASGGDLKLVASPRSLSNGADGNLLLGDSTMGMVIVDAGSDVEVDSSSGVVRIGTKAPGTSGVLVGAATNTVTIQGAVGRSLVVSQCTF